MMNKKIYTSLLALGFMLMLIVSSSGWTKRATAIPVAAPSAGDDALMALPASDAVMFVDVQRLLSEVMPRILVNHPALLAKVNSQIDQLKESTGVDVRLFDHIAIGMRFTNTPKKVEETTNTPRKESHSHKTDSSVSTTAANFVSVIRGRFDSNAVIAAGLNKAKARGQTQTQVQMHGGKTIYTDSASRGAVAVAAIDANMIAVGDMESVRAAIDASTGGGRVDAELAALARRNSSALLGFSGNVPALLLQQFGVGGDEWSSAFAAIRQVYGSMSATEKNGEMILRLRTETADQAQAITEKLAVLKQLISSHRAPVPFTEADVSPKNVIRGEPRGDSAQSTQYHSAEGANILLPGVGLIVSGKLFEKLRDLNITTEGNEVQIKLEQNLADFLPSINGSSR
ncbi:MAG: hypothetical protein H0T92_17095 [Pyrinomonadaceae bacterium]|nr:hypothetical protein [Pyrinomonadaceae bacterium]